jgi:hypothetical protein
MKLKLLEYMYSVKNEGYNAVSKGELARSSRKSKE